MGLQHSGGGGTGGLGTAPGSPGDLSGREKDPPWNNKVKYSIVNLGSTYPSQLERDIIGNHMRDLCPVRRNAVQYHQIFLLGRVSHHGWFAG